MPRGKKKTPAERITAIDAEIARLREEKKALEEQMNQTSLEELRELLRQKGLSPREAITLISKEEKGVAEEA